MSKKGVALTWTGYVSGSSLQSDLFLEKKKKRLEDWARGCWMLCSLFPSLTSGICVPTYSGKACVTAGWASESMCGGM